MNSVVGRPPIYQSDILRNDNRRIQNRNNQRKCRRRKKIFEEVNKINKSFYENYHRNIIDFIGCYDFDYFFTGTVDLRKNEREELNNINNEIKIINKTYGTEFNLNTEKKISINSLRKYTDRYIEFLNTKQMIERSFIVFEKGKNNKFHVHIMFKSNENKINFETMTENSWLIGNSITLPIDTPKDKLNIIKYCLKELKPTSEKREDIDRVDNWFITGCFPKNEPQQQKVFETIFENVEQIF
jgi:hypothetical protein